MRAARKVTGYRGSPSAHRINGAQPLVFDNGTGSVGAIQRYLNGRHVGDDHLPGIRDFMQRADAPKGVLRYRSRLLGTAQDEPVYITFEVWVSVPKPKGHLP